MKKNINIKSLSSSPTVVVGTGRSGTSVVAGMLHTLGVHMGDSFVPKDRNNATGTYEDVVFEKLMHKYIKESSIVDIDQKQAFIEELSLLIVGREEKYDLWGWKIPITSQAIDAVIKVVPKAKYIRCKRPLGEFVDSCKKAYGWSEKQAEYLFNLRSTILDKFLTENYDVLDLEFEDITKKPDETVDKIIAFCDLTTSKNKRDAAINIVKSREELEKMKVALPKSVEREPMILIGVPTYSGDIPYQTVNSLLRLHKPAQSAIQFIPRQRVEKARNIICAEALKANVTHVLFIDDDNPVPPHTLTQLLKWDKDIVTTPILQRGGDHKLCVFFKEEMLIKKNSLTMYNHVETLTPNEDGLQKIDACGMGCTLIKAEVIADLMEKYDGEPFMFGDITVDGQRRTTSEDVEFCERATKEGYEIWVDTNIRPIHLGDPQVFVYHEGVNL